MGAAAPLVQPDEPGQTVPGVAPSSKVTKSNGAPVVDVADSTPRFRASEESGPASQDARSRMHPRAVTLPPRHGTWILMGSLRGGCRRFVGWPARRGARFAPPCCTPATFGAWWRRARLSRPRISSCCSHSAPEARSLRRDGWGVGIGLLYLP